MIVSASYKTDIPAFYGRWFINRLRAGYCLMVNPYNRHQVSRVRLTRDVVDGFVFWTKNLGPFLSMLPEVRDAGYPFVIQYTINAYPRKLEFSVTDAARSVKHAQEVAAKFGPKVLVWRYDPIVVTSETPVEFHLDSFEWLAKRLAGVTDEVVVSFAQLYKKTKSNMDTAAQEFKFTWRDPGDDEKRQIARHLYGIAKSYGIQLTMCAQPYLLAEPIREAHCIDCQRLSALAGREIFSKLRGSRQECGCYESKDIGDYDTCPHGCVYCYAVRNRRLAQQRYRDHDPEGEFLFRPAATEVDLHHTPSLF